MCGGDSGELFNVLHLARLILLLVLYIFSLDFLKNVIVVRGWLADNKYLMQRRYFFKCLKSFMRANLKFCVVLVLIIIAETCLILIPPLADFFINVDDCMCCP
ncbi:hypothetical protein ACEK78_004741 [Escherichia coli]|jgi:hypothetical protein|uniref:hypothetical protein n=1 Tax=uncultured Escherichia sp. TaxID=237777 RepID=UPI000CFC0AE9|nr:hypothetical protein [uncultured Escherichia sp.]EBS5347790.1 hypothetical protein [Salmonella enterica subsp. enterica serovar Saintpaul]ECV3601768.1 hypothetical protein [Salmonella enterica]EGG0551843.1 hypothetical protein [Escherichia coli]EHW1993176.1 hypothetical protein [Salmonella enterica subsp. enterica serovar Enteritidis]PPQ50274.1 hypothetical protein C4623_23845 [Escherichia albertii]